MYINSNLDPLTKFSSSRSTEFKKNPPMECIDTLLNDHDDRSNQHENSHKLCHEKGHPLLRRKVNGN